MERRSWVGLLLVAVAGAAALLFLPKTAGASLTGQTVVVKGKELPVVKVTGNVGL